MAAEYPFDRSEVLDPGAAGPPDERRGAADGGEGAHGAVDPAGENPLGAGEEAGGTASACSAHRRGTISRRPRPAPRARRPPRCIPTGGASRPTAGVPRSGPSPRGRRAPDRLLVTARSGTGGSRPAAAIGVPGVRTVIDMTLPTTFSTVPLGRGSCERRGEAIPVTAPTRAHRPPSGLIGRMRSARMACLEWRPSTGDDG